MKKKEELLSRQPEQSREDAPHVSCRDLSHMEVKEFGKVPCKGKKSPLLPRAGGGLGFIAQLCTCSLIFFFTCVLISTSPFSTCPHDLPHTLKILNNKDGEARMLPSGSFQPSLETSFRGSPVPAGDRPWNTPSPSVLILQNKTFQDVISPWPVPRSRGGFPVRPLSPVCWFPAVTNDHKHSGLKQHKCVILQFRGQTSDMGSTKNEVSAGLILSGSAGGNLFPCLCGFLVVACIPWFLPPS